MTNLTLDVHEADVLRRALDTYLRELRIWASRTDAQGLKRSMWEDEHVIERLLGRLSADLIATP